MHRGRIPNYSKLEVPPTWPKEPATPSIERFVSWVVVISKMLKSPTHTITITVVGIDCGTGSR